MAGGWGVGLETGPLKQVAAYSRFSLLPDLNVYSGGILTETFHDGSTLVNYARGAAMWG